MMDRMTTSCVGRGMVRSIGSALFASLLALGLVACGGKKNEKTTPGGGSGSGSGGQSMNDTGDPDDPGPSGGGTPGGGTTGGGPAGGGGTVIGPDGTPVPADPPIDVDGATGANVVPPNFDPDPQMAKAQVDGHLALSKNALNQAKPDADTALAEARKALAIDASSVDAAAMVALAYFHKRLYDTAELVLDDLYKRDAAKGNANVNYVYGLVYDATARPDRARLAYQKALSANPNHASALINLGVHQLRNSQYGDAQRTFERLTKELGRTDAITRTSLGSAYRGRAADYPTGANERDRFVRAAEAEYKRALQATSSYGPAYYNLGLLYLDNDPFPGVADPLARLNAAKAYFDQYKNMPGVNIKLYDERMKDVTKAIKRVEKQLKKKKKAG